MAKIDQCNNVFGLFILNGLQVSMDTLQVSASATYFSFDTLCDFFGPVGS